MNSLCRIECSPGTVLRHENGCLDEWVEREEDLRPIGPMNSFLKSPGAGPQAVRTRVAIEIACSGKIEIV